MNRKKGLIITLALAFFRIQGYVVTGCDVYADSIKSHG
jgi:hypothetical protein